MALRYYIILFILILGSFILGAQFYKQEIWPFGRGYEDTFKKFIKHGIDYKNIVSEEERVKNLRNFYLDLELNAKQSLKNFTFSKEEIISLDDSLVMTKYLIEPQTLAHGIAKITPGTGYLDFYEDKLFILSSRGIIGFSDSLGKEKLEFGQIENNLNFFLNKKQFLIDDTPESRISFKDLAIIDNSIYVSYTEEVSPDCWNTGVIFSKINFKRINFIKLFSSTGCVKFNRKFNAQEAGGRIVRFDDNHILLSVGTYGRKSANLAQDMSSINGKIIKINTDDTSYEIISLGHRNPEGLYYDREKNFLLETEHGPAGGDEINIIKLNNKPVENNNYGWPYASYGAHYGDDIAISESHNEKNFLEPLKYFIPSIGISEITKLGKETYVTGSMANRALWFFKIESDNIINELKRVSVKERIRDIKFKDKKLFLFLEDTASIGIIPTDSLSIK